MLWVFSVQFILDRENDAGYLHNVTFCRHGESASECFMSGDSLDISFGSSPHVSTGQLCDPASIMCENIDQNHSFCCALR